MVGGAGGAVYSAMDTNGMVCGYLDTPKWSTSLREWVGSEHFRMFLSKTPAPNHQRTTLSRAEYFHLYPAPDDDGWIELSTGKSPVKGEKFVWVKYRDGETNYCHADGFNWSVNGLDSDIIAYSLHKPEQAKPEQAKVEESKPTIEQLAADYRNANDFAERKRQEADAAKADAGAKLAELVAAGKAIGLALGVEVAEPELVITDWRDLRVGDEVEAKCHAGTRIGLVTELESVDYEGCRPFRFKPFDETPMWCTSRKFKFILRP